MRFFASIFGQSGAVIPNPDPDPEPETGHNVLTYGAVGDGVTDDTDAIWTAIDAAKTSTNKRVYFPGGYTFKVMQRGTSKVTVYNKSSGSWGTAVASNQTEDAVFSGLSNDLYFRAEDPIPSLGSDGDLCLNNRTGMVWLKSGGGWAEDAKLSYSPGTGWQSGFITHTPEGGSDGDWAIMYRVEFDNSAIFELNQDYNYLIFEGDGPTSVISQYCWGDIHPQDYEVDTDAGTITYSHVPYTSDEYARRYGRGFIFHLESDYLNTPFQGIEWRNLKIDGNTTASGDHGFGTPYESLHEWDINHKGIVYGFGGSDYGTIAPIKTVNVIGEGFRGECFYRGGTGDYAYIEVTGCYLNQSNGSAISISGHAKIDNCTFENVYNGIENQCQGVGQYSEVSNCTFNMKVGTWSTRYGVVYLSDEDTSHLKVTGCVFNDAMLGGVFLADGAINADIDWCDFNGGSKGVYVKYGNFSGGTVSYKYDNINIRNCTFNNVYSCIEFPNETAPTGTGVWTVDSCTCSGDNIWAFLSTNCEGPRSGFDVTISNCNASSGKNSWAMLQRTSSSYRPMVPRYSNNAYMPSYNEGSWGSGVYLDEVPSGPTIHFTAFLPDEYQMDDTKFATGEQVRIENGTGSSIVMVAEEDWNNFTGGSVFLLQPNTYFLLEKDASGGMNLVQSGEL